jgi:hypothetical protein
MLRMHLCQTYYRNVKRFGYFRDLRVAARQRRSRNGREPTVVKTDSDPALASGKSTNIIAIFTVPSGLSLDPPSARRRG